MNEMNYSKAIVWIIGWAGGGSGFVANPFAAEHSDHALLISEPAGEGEAWRWRDSGVQRFDPNGGSCRTNLLGNFTRRRL